MNATNKKTLKVIFEKPTLGNIEWKKIEKLFIALGASVSEGNGSRVRIRLNDRKAIFHRPHPQKDANKYVIEAVRDFLVNAGVKP
jgi:hypothetical protein